MADAATSVESGAFPGLVASFFTLSGAGFAQPPRNGFVQRCEAAAAAGFTGIGLHADDLPRTIAAGVGVEEMRKVLELNGLELVEIEFLGGWAGGGDRIAPALPAIEQVAAELGGRVVSAGEFAADHPLDTEEALDGAARALKRHADRLARHGLLVAVESFPWSALTNTAAREILRRADAPNAGLLIDVWHYYNGGGSPDDLVDLPGAGVASMQLNDGPLVHEDFLTHARARRELPGEGELDVVGLIRAVRRSGFTGPFCVESNTPTLRALPVEEAARRAADAAFGVLRAAGVPLP